jgi:hypothetical protein
LDFLIIEKLMRPPLKWFMEIPIFTVNKTPTPTPLLLVLYRVSPTGIEPVFRV